MNALDELLKDTFDEDAHAVPDDGLLAARVMTRAHRQMRRARLGLVATAAALLVVAGFVGAHLISSEPVVLTPAGPPDPSTADVGSYQSFLDELARWAEVAESSEVEPIRTLDDGLEHSLLVKDCLAAAGYPGNAHSFATDPEQMAFQRAVYTCYAQYRLDERLYEPRTESQIRFIRDFWIESSIPCLADLGYDIPQPPSAEVLIESWDSLDRYSVEGELSDRSSSEAVFIEALQRCPALPPLAEILSR